MTIPGGDAVKLDAFLARQVGQPSTGRLRVLITLSAQIGAASRVRALLKTRNSSVDKRLRGGRLFVATIDARDLVVLTASDAVERLSLDAIVTAQEG